MTILSMRLDDELERRLAMEAEHAQKSRSEVVRDALTAYLRDRERRRFEGELVRAAQSIDPAEARAIAEEALPFDNEAMGTAEPEAPYVARRKAKRRKT